MKIQIKKLSPYFCEYKLNGDKQNTVITGLDVKTYLIHDITHFVVEQHLDYKDGFWGMLAQGYGFNELSGKENELTPGLRAVEKIVGPVQSVYMGFVKKEEFEMHTSHLDIKIDLQGLENCLDQIKKIESEWKQLAIGEELVLIWSL
jgi:hypothetical protein